MKTTRQAKKQLTMGLDLGDRKHAYCVLDGEGAVVKEGSVVNEREALIKWTVGYPGALVIMEAGTHSPWISRLLQE